MALAHVAGVDVLEVGTETNWQKAGVGGMLEVVSGKKREMRKCVGRQETTSVQKKLT